MRKEIEFPTYLSSSKIKQQLKELEVIYQNQSFVEKITRPITHTLAQFINPYASYYSNANGLKSFLAENLLRHYYNGHESLGTGTADAAVAKASRAVHLRSRHNAGPAQRAIAAYEKYLAETPGAVPELKTVEDYPAYDVAHGKTLPTKLLECLKDELLAKGEEINLKGSLAAVIYVIQEKCDLTVINLRTINRDISEAKKINGVGGSASKSQASFWSKVNPLNYFSGSSSKDAAASQEFFDKDGLDDSSEASL